MKNTDKDIANELTEVKNLLAEILKRLNNLEYTGTVYYGDPYSAYTKSKTHIKVTLNRNEEETPNPYGDDDYATPS